MRRRLNFRGLLILAVVATVAGAGTFLLHRYQVRRNAEALYERAQAALADPTLREREKLTRATDYLRRYLGFNPNDPERLYEYANLRAHEKVATSPMARLRAITILDRALRNPSTKNRDKERHRLIDLALEVGRTNDALRHVDALLAGNPQSAELLMLRGRCAFEAHKYSEAREYYERALRAADPPVEAYDRLAHLLRQQGEDVRRKRQDLGRVERLDELAKVANDRIAAMVKANPNSAKAHLARATYSRLYRDDLVPEERVRAIEQDILRARELAGDDPDVLMALAELAAFRRDPALARGYLLAGCGKHPENWRLYLALSDLERDDGKFDAAVAALQKGLSNVPEQPDLLWALANLCITRGDKEQFKTTVDRLGAAGLPPPERDFLKGRFAFQAKEWATAKEDLKKAFPGLQGRIEGGRNHAVLRLAVDAGLMLGECHDQLGDFDDAFAAYSLVRTIAPASVKARLGMAVAKRKMGQVPEALDAYRELLRLPDAPPAAVIDLARLTLVRNLDRDVPDWDEVDRALAQAERLPGLPAEVVLMRLEALARQEKRAEARDYLQRLMLQPIRLLFPAPRPEQVVIALRWQQEKLPVVYYLARAALAELDGKPAEALRWLQESVKEYDDPVYLRMALVGYWSRRGGPEAAKALGLLEGDLTRYAADERRQLLTALAEAQRILRQAAEEKRLWDRIVAENPKDLRAHLALFDLALAARDEAAVRREGAAIKDIEGDRGVLWRYAEVRRLLLEAERESWRTEAVAKAREQLAAIAARNPNWSRVAVCHAILAELEKKPDLAADKYMEAFRKGERGFATLSRAFELLYARGRLADARQVLKKLPRERLSGDVARVAAEVIASSRDPREAIRIADASVAAKPADARLQLWAGRIYWQANESEKAEAAMRKACELADAPPEAWVSLVYFLMTGGRKAEAAVAVARMEKAVPEKSAVLAYAQCYDAVGDRDKAARYYAQALASKPDDPATLRGVATYYLRTNQLPEAKRMLKRLAEEAPAKAPEMSTWASNALKVIDFLGADYKERQEKLAGLGRPDALPAGADRQLVADQRTRAHLLARQQGRKNREEAARILENLVTLGEATAEDYFQLGMLYERQEQWSRASKQFDAMMGLAGGQRPPYLAHYARGLLRRDRTDEARQVLERLEKIDPSGFPTAEVRARLLHKQGQTRGACELLERRAASGEDLVPTAALLEEFGDGAAAERLLVLHARGSGRANGAYPLVGLYARQKQGAKALEVCEEIAKKCPLDDLIDLCLQILGEEHEDPALLARAEKLLEGAGKAGGGKSASLTTALGHLRTLQRRDAEAEQIYRQAIARNPKDVLALNALAWLLSMQPKTAKEAFELTQKAVAVSGPFPWLLDTQAGALLAMGQAEKAIQLLEEVVADQPTAVAYFHLAKAYHQARNNVNARRALERASKGGLKLGELHPSERPGYEKLRRELDVP
jgi:tetratricopeptide (TPR) repeat protein